MKRTFLLFFAGIILAGCSQQPTVCKVWTKEQAGEWYKLRKKNVIHNS